MCMALIPHCIYYIELVGLLWGDLHVNWAINRKICSIHAHRQHLDLQWHLIGDYQRLLGV